MARSTKPNDGARRRFLGVSLAGLIGGSWLALGSRDALASEDSGHPLRRGLHPNGAPAADTGYSPGIAAQPGKIVFVSGQGPQDLDASMETQMHQTFERIGRVLEEGGASFAHIVMMRSYFVNIERDLPIFRKVRREYLLAPYPASSAVGVPALAIKGLEIEIEAQAVVRGE
ncbi:MAG: Rid family hydrolase [Pirellulales bacterium]